MSQLEVPVPRAFLPLLAPRRFKGAYGGRGSGKSHFFGGRVAEMSAVAEKRIVCIREVQDTLQDSVHQLIVDKINALRLGGFQITKEAITHVSGSRIIFRGMQHYNATNIKSLEGFDIAWVEEAQDFSQKSFDMLYPTIRKPGSELWFSWNPRYSTDAIDKFFRANPPDPDVIAVEANWRDNPWFGEELRKDMERDFRNDPDRAEHIWNGGYLTITEGSYFGTLIFKAEKEGRIAPLPHDPALPVYVAFDLGIGDDTSIWFAQRSGGWLHIIDHYATNGQPASHYVDVLRAKPYNYASIFLPHDADNREWSNGKSRLDTLKSLAEQYRFQVLPRLPVDDGINAVRLLLPKTRFDSEKCKAGLEALRQYRREYDENKRTFKPTPLHDWSSHDADAFRYLAVGLEPEAAGPTDYPKYTGKRRWQGNSGTGASGWAA
jgi:phage terminase large subunit